MTNLFTMEELLSFNEMLLGRGMPVEHDGIGYSKADYGACATYFYGLSDAQLADLAKRLVKYTETQLGIDKQKMKDTAEYLAEVAGDADRSDGISVNITENGTLIAFRYNETFIEIVKKQPKRQYDAENRQWIIPNDKVMPLLNELWMAGADVQNAMKYVLNHDIMQEVIFKKTEVLTKFKDNLALIKFNYDKDIVDVIKELDKKDRQWNAEFKFWAINIDCFETLKEKLSLIAEFKTV